MQTSLLDFPASVNLGNIETCRFSKSPIVRQSGMDWTITQPVHLTDRVDSEDKAYISNTNEVEDWKVSRQLVGQINAKLALDENSYGKTITVSTKHSVKKSYCNSNAACRLVENTD